MSRPLHPTDLLKRDPAAQIVSLPDGRVLARHATGITLLRGVAEADLRRALDLADGTRSAAEICDALADEHDSDSVKQLLANLAGDLLRIVPGPDAETAPRVFLLADKAARARFAASLALTPDLSTARLAVAALGETSYRDLLDLQTRWLAAGVPSLFVTADPDGLRIGPLTVPGTSPCFACAQLAALGVLRLSPNETLAAAAELRTGSLATADLDRAATLIADEARALFDSATSPDLLFQIFQILPSGTLRRLPVERRPDCPLCGAVSSRDDAAIAHQAERVRIETEERRPPRVMPAEEGGLVTSVGILGGGTAGYLTALALRRKVPGLSVTLIESPDVPIIGVGEATTPLMPQFLHVDLGLDVHRFFREVLPTFKLGIRFLWGLPETGDFHYPFGPVRFLEPAVYGGDLKEVSLQSLLMAAGAVPVYAEGGGWSCRLGTEVAYHLDNQRFVAYLKRRAAEAGVEMIEATVADVERSEDGGEVRALLTADGRRLSFDLFVDCTGFLSLLLERTLSSPWIGFESSLWTDRAIVAPVPHGGTVRPYTTAETMSCGWCWSTPQADCDHRGYVFASAFQTPKDAEAEMRRGNPGMGEARMVRFRAGRHGDFWKGNVVALGNAYGFVEPLESTALHMLIRQIGLLVRVFPVRQGERGLPEELSRKLGAWWDYLRWFLALHYKFNRKMDSPFWRACRNDVDVSLHAGLLTAFRERGPLTYDPAARAAFDYPDPLWGPEGIDAILVGQGVEGHRPRPLLDLETWRDKMSRARTVAGRAERHERALELLSTHPELLDQMVAAFREAGPAFPLK